MESLYFLIPIAIIFVATAVKLYFWAVNSGQYDDLETEGRRILFDEDDPLDPLRAPPRDQPDGEEHHVDR
ncbi:cbb3-type cytochrome oxidase assembly protein CcoS [Microbulbifer yueqingensis]|uniref:Cytochrome oxidase maturation protein, cbb3-type n=1 Tax=Microbulbifer yueqingensis TaxID=658219 RepID=A0A1G8WT92_9GAMM|nr:cbb3-type cytochrome oxidase assembly protein CcoS [Microbulbifer yueqingensis]SDJ81464.1 cytochrome oxidase maturation protein, cbb3-type [Microbulbifer yueqingensis]